MEHLADEPFTQCTGDSAADLLLMIAWNTLDHTNLGIGANGGEFDIPAACVAPLPTANGDGTFTVVSPQPIPPDATGSACVLIQGHPSHDFNDGRGVQVIPVPNALTFVSITDKTPVPRRTVVEVKKCDSCHEQLNPLAHGGDRVETADGCTFCHDPNATDQATRVQLGIVTEADAVAMAPDQLQEQAIDFKILIHAVHFGPNRGLVQNAPFVIYHNASVNNFTTLTPFPARSPIVSPAMLRERSIRQIQAGPSRSPRPFGRWMRRVHCLRIKSPLRQGRRSVRPATRPR